MRQCHRLQNSIHNHRRPEASAKPEKKHVAPLIAAKRLHGGVIDYLYWTSKCLAKLNFIQTPSRLCGSRRGGPLITGPGYPNDTRSKIQSLAQFLTSPTIFLAVMDGLEAI